MTKPVHIPPLTGKAAKKFEEDLYKPLTPEQRMLENPLKCDFCGAVLLAAILYKKGYYTIRNQVGYPEDWGAYYEDGYNVCAKCYAEKVAPLFEGIPIVPRIFKEEVFK